MALLTVRDLEISFPSATGQTKVVDGVSFDIDSGDFVGIVGESGSGKSMTMSACTQLVPRPGRITAGSIRLDETELVGLPEEQMREMRGRVVSMVFQDAMTALHPSLTIEKHFRGVIKSHQRIRRDGVKRQAREMLDLVGIRDIDRKMGQYPHQLSGGQRQRVMIALAIVNKPKLLLADEPTTALDVTLQAQVIDLLRDLHRDMGLAVALVSHNLGVVGAACDRIMVMRDGQVLEDRPTRAVISEPEHAYTVRLLAAVPRVDGPLPSRPAQSQPADVVMACEGVIREFGGAAFRSDRAHRAVDEISLDVLRGRTLGLVGESGAGKTTLARCMVRLDEPTAGTIAFEGADITHTASSRLGDIRRRVQMVFQDPSTALSPRRTIAQILAEPVKLHHLRAGSDVDQRVDELLAMVELPDALRHRYPSQLSGGQRQRVGIARALACEPDLLIADEPVSALDVTIQQQLVELFARLQQELDLTLVIVAHDLGLVRMMCDEIAIMRHGRLVEYGDTSKIFSSPENPYTETLLAAAHKLTVARAGSSPTHAVESAVGS